MKVYEILKSVNMDSERIDWSKVDRSKFKEIFRIDGNPVYEYIYDGEKILLVLQISGEDAAYVNFDKMTLHGYKYNYLDRAFTVAKYRGKGLALKIIVRFRKKDHTKILSDDHMTVDGFLLWKKLRNYLPIRVIDFTTGELYDINDIPDDEVYVSVEAQNKYLYVIESYNPKHHLEHYVTGPITESTIIKSYIDGYIEEQKDLRNFEI